MGTSNTDRPKEPDRRFLPDDFFTVIERTRGRLQALDYAVHGLAALTGPQAACLSWVIADVLQDLKGIGSS